MDLTSKLRSKVPNFILLNQLRLNPAQQSLVYDRIELRLATINPTIEKNIRSAAFRLIFYPDLCFEKI
jgi:hypothetical protein